MGEERRDHVPDDDPAPAGARQLRRQHEVLLAKREEPPADLAPERRPAHERQDDRDREEHLLGRPVSRQRGREGEPDRDRRQGLQELDQPLDHDVREPADVAGDPAEHHPQNHRERHGGEADRHRGSGAVHEARPLVAAQAIGAENMDALTIAGRGGAQQVNPGRDDPEQAVRMPRDEEPKRDLPALVDAPLHAERGRVALARDRRNPGRETPAVEQVQSLDGNEGEPGVGRLGILRADEIGKQHDRVEDQQD